MRTVVLGALGIALAACARDTTTEPLVAPFNERTILGEVSAVWSNTSEERGFAGGTRLQEPEIRFQYRVDVRNRLGDKLFVRPGDFQLVDEHGLALGSDGASVECSLGSGATQAILTGDVWVRKRAVSKVRTFRIARFAVPLNERGRGLYREWLLQGRPGAAAAIDAEIARYAAAPPCPAR